MRPPDLPGILYLVYLLLLMPWMAIRSKAQFEEVTRPAGEGDGPRLSRTQIYTSTLISLGVLLLASWLVGRGFGFDVLAFRGLGAREWVAGGLVLGIQLGLMGVSWLVRSEAERRDMAIYRLIPRTPSEWGWFSLLALTAGVAEEAAYRGVLTALLTWTLGSFPAAVAISALAFAVSHALQGWKSGVIIFLMALSMHYLVSTTETLVVAMVVHAVYDLIAGLVGAWRIRAGDANG